MEMSTVALRVDVEEIEDLGFDAFSLLRREWLVLRGIKFFITKFRRSSELDIRVAISSFKILWGLKTLLLNVFKPFYILKNH